MSHISTLSESKNNCKQDTGCADYQTLLQQEESKVDGYTAQMNYTAIAWGLLFVLIGLILVLTPFVKSLKKVQAVTLPKLAMIVPVVVGIVAGGYFGFVISFSACYKQSCSPLEATAMYTLPVLSLLLSIPIARIIHRKQKKIAQGVNRLKPAGWIGMGLIIIAITAVYVVSVVDRNNTYGTRQKAYLRTVE